MQDMEGDASGSSRRVRLGGNYTLPLSNMNSHQYLQGALKCPRCDSLNTKFCYYNNYNLSQPRHFCKSCRRYWTNGGVLRNVPVGGGCRKAKRSSKSKRTPLPTSQSTAAESTAPLQEPSPPLFNGIITPSTVTGDAAMNFEFSGVPTTQTLWGHHRLDLDWQGTCGTLGQLEQSLFDLPSITAGGHSYWGSTTVTGTDHQELQNNAFFP